MFQQTKNLDLRTVSAMYLNFLEFSWRTHNHSTLCSVL